MNRDKFIKNFDALQPGARPFKQPRSIYLVAALLIGLVALALVFFFGVKPALFLSSGFSKHSFTYRGHNGIINSVAFSPDGRYIISGSMDGTAQVWIWQPNALAE